MTKLQIEIFWEEIERLQKQYSLFFQESQKQYISLQEKDGVYELVFLDGYELSSSITLDIRLLHSIVQDLSFGRGGIGGLCNVEAIARPGQRLLSRRSLSYCYCFV